MTKFAECDRLFFNRKKGVIFKTGFSDGRSTFVFTAMSSRMRTHSAVTIENGNRVTAAVTIATAFVICLEKEFEKMAKKT